MGTIEENIDQFLAGLIPEGKPQEGGYNITQFWKIREGSKLANAYPGVRYLASRTPIENAPRMDPQRWKSAYVERQLMPNFADFCKERNLPYIIPHFQFATAKDPNRKEAWNDEISWSQVKYGTSLSNTNRFPEGTEFPESVFKKMIGILPALAEWTDQLPEALQPRVFNFQQYLREFGIETNEEEFEVRGERGLTEEDKLKYVINYKGKKVLLNGEYQEVIDQYHRLITGLQLQNKPSIDYDEMGEVYHSCMGFNSLLLSVTSLLSENDHRTMIQNSAKVIIPSLNQFIHRPGSSVNSSSVDNELYPTLPPLVEWNYPEERNTKNYAKHELGKFLEQEVYQKYRKEFDDEKALFAELCEKFGIPEQPLALFYEEAKQLHDRPFILIHDDLHRKNIMESDVETVEKDQKLVIFDWDSMDLGDFVFAGTRHVYKIRYNEEQEHRYWDELLQRMPAKYVQNKEVIEQDIQTYKMFLTINEIIVMLVRSTMEIAEGKLNRDNYATNRNNLLKLVNALKIASKGEKYKSKTGPTGEVEIEGWEKAAGIELDAAFNKIEQFVNETTNEKIMKMREKRDREVTKQETAENKSAQPPPPSKSDRNVFIRADLEPERS